MKTIAYLERTRTEYPAQWKATTDKGENLTIIQYEEITIIDGKDKQIFKAKSPKTFGIDFYSLKQETAKVLKWPVDRPPLPPQDPPTCSHCKRTEKVIDVQLRTPGRVNQFYSEKSRLCDPCRKGPFKARFRKI